MISRKAKFADSLLDIYLRTDRIEVLRVCEHPRRAIRYQYVDGNGEVKFRLRFLKLGEPVPFGYAVLDIPCGKCDSCRARYASDWAARCVFEEQYHEHVWFLTLTYDNENIPKVGEMHTLRYKHVQDFLKKLRYYFPDSDIRYLVCGEYGPRLLRPHYHMVLFGPDLDVYLDCHDSHGNPLYKCDVISKCWPFGYYMLAEGNGATAAYVAGYTSKKMLPILNDILDIHPELEKPFIKASKRPALGRRYFDDHPEIAFEQGQITLLGQTVRIPLYFDRLLQSSDSDRYEKMKERRREKVQEAYEMKMRGNSYSIDELKAVEIENQKARRALKKKERKDT